MYINLKSDNYNFIKADENSRLLVTAVLDNGIRGEIRASSSIVEIFLTVSNKIKYYLIN